MSNYTDGMTLEEQIGQLLMVGFWETTPSQEVIDLIKNYHVGNIIFFSRNIIDAQQVLELTQSLQSIAKEAGHRYPLLIAIDQENGLVQRLGEAATIFPGNMALGAIGSEEITYQVALATGRELQSLGINMNLAPVVDINNNPANPVIGVRSFGEDPHLVARLGAAMVKGYAAAGIISCLKHFPGHGDTAVDSHLSLPVIRHTFERLEALELVPFRSGIEAGAESVMIAHVAFPTLVESIAGASPATTNLVDLPVNVVSSGTPSGCHVATLSRAIVQNLLREQLNFHGIIISDCLEMHAISATFGTQLAAVMALQAGIDLVLVSHNYPQQRGSIESIKAAIQAGELSQQTISQAAERILSHKARHLSWDNLPTSTSVSECIERESHTQLQAHAYGLSTTLVRNEDHLLPLHPGAEQRIVVLSPQRNTMSMVEDRYYSDEVLADIIKRYHTPVEILPIAPGTAAGGYEQLLKTTTESDIFIVATVNAHLDEEQAELVRYLISSGRRVIGIAARNPYDLQVFPQLRTYLATYEYTPPALEAAVRVIFGEREARGHLPVSIPTELLS